MNARVGTMAREETSVDLVRVGSQVMSCHQFPVCKQL